MSQASEADLPELTIRDCDDAMVALLRELQAAVLAHPDAAVALFGALVREGRAFAQTREGARVKQTVLRSALLERALLVWQAATLFVPQQPEGAVPSSIVDAIAGVAAGPRREALLQELFTTWEEG